MKFLLSFIVLSIVLFPAADSHATNRALLIGVGEYQMKGADLPGIKKDINMMRQVALSLGYDNKEILTLLDKDATFKNIQGCSGNFAGSQGFIKVRFIHNAATGAVDDHDAVLHLIESGFVQ